MPDYAFQFLVRMVDLPLTARRRLHGQGLVEYALITLFVVIVVVGILTAVGRTLCTTWYEKLVNITAWGTGTVGDPCP